MIYIVVYDLLEPGQHYDSLIKKIKEYDGWAKLGYSCFLIKTEKYATEVRDELIQFVDENDKLYVGKVTTPAAWLNMPKDVVKWINDNL